VRDLRGVIEREKAQIGVFITMHEPTRPMRKEAASADFYRSPVGTHPRLQILTVTELLSKKGIDYPAPLQRADVTFKPAPRARREEGKQLGLDMVAETPATYRKRRKPRVS